jgi:Ca2+-binding RTX toxin-like protein
VVEASGAGTDLVYSSIGYGLGSNVENLTLTGSANINGYGNSLANALTGNAGNNALNGLAGADTMAGGAGNDTYFVDNAGDSVVEASGAGTDLVYSSITYTLGSNVENLTLTGSANINGIGNNLANTLTGNSGNNQLYGAAGADAMAGGAGDDTYYVDDIGDSVTEASGAGTDLVYSSIGYALGNNVENLILTGSGNINGYGNSLANTLTGNAGNNALNGLAGADVMAGGAGNDTYFVDNAGDAVVEASGAGTDLVYSSIGYGLGNNVENLTLTGSGNINGYGNSLANTLTGNAGNNFIAGGLGNDMLTGGGGQDTFLFDTALAGNVDTVADFNGSNDTIRLDQSVFTAITTLGTLSAAAFFAGAAAHDSDDRIIFNSATGNLFYDSDGTGAAAAVQFAHLNGAPSVSNTSFNAVA